VIIGRRKNEAYEPQRPGRRSNGSRSIDLALVGAEEGAHGEAALVVEAVLAEQAVEAPLRQRQSAVVG
jgi:hypothetical protein